MYPFTDMYHMLGGETTKKKEEQKMVQRKPWECPRCKTVNAPHVETCKCTTPAPIV